VLIEKPIATSTADAEELQRRAAAQRRILMVGHVFVFNGAIRWIKDYVARGELGPLYYISMVRTNLGPIRMDVNAAWDLAAHDVSILNYWLDGEPEWVSARTGCWINPGIADVMFATLGYADSRLAHIHVSWLNPKKAREISVAGARRMLTFDDMNLAEPIRVYDKQVTDARTTPAYVDTFASFRASVRDGDITIPRVAGGEPLRRECDHFLECVINHRTPETDAASGTSVVRVLEAMDRSAANGGASESLR
jgi:predicted dehydrogenase